MATGAAATSSSSSRHPIQRALQRPGELSVVEFDGPSDMSGFLCHGDSLRPTKVAGVSGMLARPDRGVASPPVPATSRRVPNVAAGAGVSSESGEPAVVLESA
mmetsp:Transcript_2731/g.9615  ORF Transcript_2731/g.9615 Transcript_2731/m.9615 type:complete len:103 (-) Transcript_2731:98-406(-)